MTDAKKDEYAKLSEQIASRLYDAAMKTASLEDMYNAIDREAERCKPIVREFFIANGYDLEKIDRFMLDVIDKVAFKPE